MTRDVTQSFITVPGVRLFMRREGKLKTKINPLETLGIKLLCSKSPLGDPQILCISFSGLDFPRTTHFTVSDKSFTVPMPPWEQHYAIFLVLNMALWAFGACSPTPAFSLLTAFLWEHSNSLSWLQGLLPRPRLGLHLFGIYLTWKIVGLLKNT